MFLQANAEDLHGSVQIEESFFTNGEDTMSERLPCKTPGCPATILPTTALKTGGICMPCHHKKLALEKKAYILQKRKDVDRYAGIADPVEILKIMHTPRKYNPFENDLPFHKSAQDYIIN